MLRIATPDHAGSREQARNLIQPVPGDLSGRTVGLDCSKMIVGTPSFLDEVVKPVLELRGAEALEVNLSDLEGYLETPTRWRDDPPLLPNALDRALPGVPAAGQATPDAERSPRRPGAA